MSDLKKINAFLGGVDLAKYQKKYSQIKLVELDMDKDVQAIRHLYREYWERRGKFPSYEDFYTLYSSELRKELECFRREKMFSEETFYRGLPARIYRTWASLLTQIQGGYVAEKIYGRGNVAMSADLDYKGIDMQLTDGDDIINVQIKKKTTSREVRAPWQGIRNKQPAVFVTYEVTRHAPLTPITRQPCKPFNDWRKKWSGKLKRLDNGFIVFLPGMFSRDSIKMP